MRRFTLALTALLLSTSAHAAIVNGSYTGTVYDYYTSRPFFTDNAADVLNGLTITGTFQYDTGIGGTAPVIGIPVYSSYPNYSSVFPQQGSPTGVSYTGTINGRTIANTGTTLTFVASNGGNFQLQAVDYPTGTSRGFYLNADGPFVPGLMPVTDLTFATGHGTIYDFFDVVDSASMRPFTQVDFNISSLTIFGQQPASEPAQAVPEPASIAVLGLGLVGLWRARRAAQGSAA